MLLKFSKKKKKREDFSLLDEEKVQQESKYLEGAHMEYEFDTFVIDQPSEVHEDKKLDEVETLIRCFFLWFKIRV